LIGSNSRNGNGNRGGTKPVEIAARKQRLGKLNQLQKNPDKQSSANLKSLENAAEHQQPLLTPSPPHIDSITFTPPPLLLLSLRHRFSNSTHLAERLDAARGVLLREHLAARPGAHAIEPSTRCRVLFSLKGCTQLASTQYQSSERTTFDAFFSRDGRDHAWLVFGPSLVDRYV
jgi:hypothetical protein